MFLLISGLMACGFLSLWPAPPCPPPSTDKCISILSSCLGWSTSSRFSLTPTLGLGALARCSHALVPISLCCKCVFTVWTPLTNNSKARTRLVHQCLIQCLTFKSQARTLVERVNEECLSPSPHLPNCGISYVIIDYTKSISDKKAGPLFNFPLCVDCSAQGLFTNGWKMKE